MSGLGACLFAEAFETGVSPDIVSVNNAFNFLTAHYDLCCDFDKNRDISTFIDEAYIHMMEGHANSPEIIGATPFIEFIKRQIVSDCYLSFVSKVKDYKDLVIDIRNAEPQKRRELREQMGSSYGDLVSNLINTFSDNQLRPDQEQAIRYFSAASVLLDDFLDIYEDASTVEGSYIVNGKDTLSNYIAVFSRMRYLFSKSVSVIEDKNQAKKFNRIVKTGMVFSSLLFVYKTYVFEKAKILGRTYPEICELRYPITKSVVTHSRS